MIRYFSILIILLGFACNSIAQSKLKPPKKSTINKYSRSGKRHGMWVNIKKEKLGEPAYTEFGKYIEGKKYGIWYKLDKKGDIVAKETYRNDVLDGEVKLYENGRLSCVGVYRGLNPTQQYDSIVIEDPITGVQQLVGIASEMGTVKHGMWYFYDTETGRMNREEEYQIDVMIHAKDYPYSKSDSLFYNKRNSGLPHKKKGDTYYKPPEGKRASYMN